MPNVKTKFFQFFRHSGPAVATQRKAELVADVMGDVVGGEPGLQDEQGTTGGPDLGEQGVGFAGETAKFFTAGPDRHDREQGFSHLPMLITS